MGNEDALTEMRSRMQVCPQSSACQGLHASYISQQHARIKCLLQPGGPSITASGTTGSRPLGDTRYYIHDQVCICVFALLGGGPECVGLR